MFMPFAFLLLVLTVPLAGGRLSRLADVRLRSSGLIVVALALQVLMASVIPDAPRALLVSLHAASYVLIAWTLWVNRALPGLLVIAAGGATNAGVIALNGGTLPASARALTEAGFTIDPAEFKNSGVVQDPVLPWLGDIMATPAWLPFRNVISIGDLVVLVGAAVLLHVACRSRLAAVLPSVRRQEVTVASAAETASPARTT